jgi:hypothetical protein
LPGFLHMTDVRFLRYCVVPFDGSFSGIVWMTSLNGCSRTCETPSLNQIEKLVTRL